MKNYLLSFLLLFSLTTLQAQGIFDASIHTAVPFGDVDSPAAETSQQVIDQDPMTKYLDFNEPDGMGFDVDLLGVAATAASIRIVTANDAPERDPDMFEVLGSMDGTNYESITMQELPCVPDRFLARTFQFDNTVAYTHYRVNFTGTCAPSSINQIADVQLFESIGAAPVILCADDVTVDASAGECSAIVELEVLAEDDEDGELTPVQTLGLPSGSAFPVGSTDIVFEVQDSDGNMASCSYTVTVRDGESPVVTCPDNITVAADPSTNTAIVDYEVTPTDNCALANMLEVEGDYIALGNLDGKVYYVSTTGYTPEEALIASDDLDGFIGTIRNEEDNQFILDAVGELTGGAVELLIGYTDLGSEGYFYWLSEDPSTYENWNDGEPNNSGANGDPEDFTVMLSNGKWNDIALDQSRLYLLELDYELVQTEGLSSGSAFPMGTTTNTFTTVDVAGNEGTCSFTITVDDGSSVEDQILAAGIELSPNPAQNQIIIENSTNIWLEEIAVFNTQGVLVQSVKVNPYEAQYSIDIADLASGIYVVRINGEEGMVSKKLVKF